MAALPVPPAALPIPPMAGTKDVIITPLPGETLTYDQSFALMSDAAFRGRVQVACLSYAQYITLEPPAAAAHNTRMKWALNTFQNPAMVAMQTTPPTVMNPNVQLAGSAVSDQELQAAVQAVIDAAF